VTKQTIKEIPTLVLATAATMFLCAGAAAPQQGKYPMMEKVAANVIQKYQTISCADLKASKSKPLSGQQAEMMAGAIQQLKSNPDMRKQFIDKVSPTIVNKMFECGMIP
jgi:hypothetical protein